MKKIKNNISCIIKINKCYYNYKNFNFKLKNINYLYIFLLYFFINHNNL